MAELNSEKYRNMSWWKRRTKIEKNLVGILTVMLVSIIILIIGLIHKFGIINKNEISNVCLTQGCVTSSSEIMKNMNLKVDPCDDFYNFACGNFNERHQIPEDKTYISTTSSLSKDIKIKMKNILEQEEDKYDLRAFNLAKKLYRNCMNMTRIELENFKLLKEIVEKVGGWPILMGNQWNDAQFDWINTSALLRRLGIYADYFISMYIETDPKNNTRKIVTISQSGAGFSAKILKKGFNDTIVKAYFDIMVDTAVMFGADRNYAKAQSKTLLEFQMTLANIIIPSEERRNSTAEYNPYTIKDLQKEFPSFPWIKLLHYKFSPKIHLTENDIVIVRLPQYLKKLELLLLNTSPRILANFIMWYVVDIKIDSLGEEFLERVFKFNKIALGVKQRQPRWEFCVSYTRSLHLATGSLYVRKVLKKDSKKLMVELVSDIKTSFIDLLKKTTWIDYKTTKRAVAKAEAMISIIGYTEELVDDNKIEEYYSGLYLQDDNFMRNNLAVALFHREKMLDEFYKPYNKTDWRHQTPDYVNAFYSSSGNSIELPAAIMQGPYFEADRPQYLNYGGIGSVIGHEITHGFDDEGKQYDKDGNMVNWWEPATNKTFHEKAQCVINQYSNLTEPETNTKLNGINTQGENIADIGGLKIAYLGYQKWLERHGHESKLPGLPFTSKQLFWISFANGYCEKTRKEALKLQIMMGAHSPEYFRVNIPIINSVYFSRDFNCPLGSKMNPKYKCRLW